MTASTSPTAPAFTAADRDAVARRLTARATRQAFDWTAGGLLYWAAWVWAVIAVLAVVVPLTLSARGNVMPDGGVLTFVEGVVRWAFVAVTVGVLWMVLPTHLAAGGTRRSLHRGFAAGSAAAALAGGLVFALARLGEQALFAALDFAWVEPSGLAHAADGGVAAFFLAWSGEAVVLFVYAIVAATIVVGVRAAQTVDGATVLLGVVSLFFLLAVDVATVTGAFRTWLGRGFHEATGITDRPAIGLLLGLLVAAVAVGWFWLSARRIQLRAAAA